MPNTMQPPSPIRPVYWNDNGPVTLYAGPLSVRYGSTDPFEFHGDIRLSWEPGPRVGWSGSTHQTAATIAMIHHNHSTEGWPRVEVQVPPGTLPPLLKRLDSVPTSQPAQRASDEGPCEDLTFGAGEQLDRVIFNVINGPNILARGRLHDRERWWLGRWTLEADDWRATIDNRPNLGESVSELTRTRRQRFTHVGCIERTDGSAFTASDAATVLSELFLFLTFVRGATVGIALPTGFLGGSRIWTRWTSGLSSAYTGNFSWADPHRDADVASLWPALLACRADTRWAQALMRSIRYYAESLPARSTEVSVILAQAGLELLATAVLVDRDRRFRSEKWESKPAAWRIRKLLQAATLPLQIPAHMPALLQAKEQHGWHDAADAITAMRNTTTHWSTGKPDLDVDVWIDAERIAIFSLEHAILWSMGYAGTSLRRVDSSVVVGGSMPVPWRLSSE